MIYNIYIFNGFRFILLLLIRRRIVHSYYSNKNIITISYNIGSVVRGEKKGGGGKAIYYNHLHRLK